MRKLKPVLQYDLKDCGIASMQWIFKYYDGFVSLEKLREDTFTDNDGTNAYHIVNAFKKWGFDSHGGFVHDIKNHGLKFPLIAHVILENGLEHFVVVKSWKNDVIYLMDPGVGNTKMTNDEFNKLFTGHIIEAVPRDKIINMNKKLSVGDLFIKICCKEKFLLLKIIISSFIWTALLIVSSYYLKIGGNLIDQDRSLLKYCVFCFGMLTILKTLMLFIREYYENHLSNLVDVYIYPEFIRHLFFLPSGKIKSRTTGEIVTRINELSNIKSLFSDIFVSCVLDSMVFIISIAILFIINSHLFMILFLGVIIYIVFGVIISKLMYKKLIDNIQYQTDFNSTIVESIDMFESIKNLNVTKNILSKIENILSRCLLNNYELNSFINITNFIKDFILEISFWSVNSYGFYCVINGNINVIDLFTFNIILSYCVESVKNIINLLPRFNYIKATFSKLSEFIDLEEEKILSKNSIVAGDIIFKSVCYSYNNYDFILKNINFKIKEGNHIFLAGKSGSGKSTICKLLYKEKGLTDGEIYIGSQNIKDISISAIRNHILYVSQDEELFTATIKENILMDRDVKEKTFLDICEICAIDQIVAKKGLRYDSLIEPSSKNISGGEKQRMILARGLLKPANILVLDEALSEVDANLERVIIKNIRNYFKDKTIIYISHKNQNNSFEKTINIEELNEVL